MFSSGNVTIGVANMDRAVRFYVDRFEKPGCRRGGAANSGRSRLQAAGPAGKRVRGLYSLMPRTFSRIANRHKLYYTPLNSSQRATILP
jgi:catechol 2,3-dioxygenase-like lactoylglutathione lyase family enzyme